MQLTVTCLVDPGAFRSLHTFVQGSCDGEGRMEVVSLAATEEAPSVQHAATPEVSSSMENLHIGGNPSRCAYIFFSSSNITELSKLLFSHIGRIIWHAKLCAVCASRTADAAATASRIVHSRQQQASAEPSTQVVYARGPIADLPDEHASRRERFAELDEFQPGWQVELSSRGAGSAVDVFFYSPSGEHYKNEKCIDMSAEGAPTCVKKGCLVFHIIPAENAYICKTVRAPEYGGRAAPLIDRVHGQDKHVHVQISHAHTRHLR